MQNKFWTASLNVDLVRRTSIFCVFLVLTGPENGQLGEKKSNFEPFFGPWGWFGVMLGFCKQRLVIFWAQNDPTWPKMAPKWPQNDPKMTPKWPKMTPKWPQNDRFFQKCSYIISDHFLGCFERVLVIFGPRNAFKWPYLGSETAQNRAKNRFPQK